mgnify:FL=1
MRPQLNKKHTKPASKPNPAQPHKDDFLPKIGFEHAENTHLHGWDFMIHNILDKEHSHKQDLNYANFLKYFDPESIHANDDYNFIKKAENSLKTLNKKQRSLENLEEREQAKRNILLHALTLSTMKDNPHMNEDFASAPETADQRQDEPEGMKLMLSPEFRLVGSISPNRRKRLKTTARNTKILVETAGVGQLRLSNLEYEGNTREQEDIGMREEEGQEAKTKSVMKKDRYLLRTNPRALSICYVKEHARTPPALSTQNAYLLTRRRSDEGFEAGGVLKKVTSGQFPENPKLYPVNKLSSLSISHLSRPKLQDKVTGLLFTLAYHLLKNKHAFYILHFKLNLNNGNSNKSGKRKDVPEQRWAGHTFNRMDSITNLDRIERSKDNKEQRVSLPMHYKDESNDRLAERFYTVCKFPMRTGEVVTASVLNTKNSHSRQKNGGPEGRRRSSVFEAPPINPEPHQNTLQASATAPVGSLKKVCSEVVPVVSPGSKSRISKSSSNKERVDEESHDDNDECEDEVSQRVHLGLYRNSSI